MHTNQQGVDLIKAFEGFSASVYRCPAGIPTIGYGSIWDENGKRITMDHPDIDEATGEAWLRRELYLCERRVAKLIKVALSENEFSALVSFTYNVGSGALRRSTLRAKLNRRDYWGAANEFPKWRRAGGRVLAGLVRRRKAERSLFLS